MKPMKTLLKSWLAALTLGLAGMGVAHAQVNGCTVVDRTVKGQQAWRLVLRYGTPDQLAQLATQGCVDPNMGREFNLSSALGFIANRAMLNQAIALGWRPVEELSRDFTMNPRFVNPLIQRMILLPQDKATATTESLAQMVAQRYHLNLDLHDRRTDSEEEDTLLAVADLIPTQILTSVDRPVGVSTLVVAAAGKHERLVQALLDRRVPWGSTYLAYPNGGVRGVWDVAMDPDTCVQAVRSQIPGGDLNAKTVEQKQLSIMSSLQRAGMNPFNVRSPSAVVPGLVLDVATQEALWFSPDNWSYMRQSLSTDRAYVSEGTANDIRNLQKKLNHSLNYGSIMGAALPNSVCTAVFNGG